MNNISTCSAVQIKEGKKWIEMIFKKSVFILSGKDQLDSLFEKEMENELIVTNQEIKKSGVTRG